MAEDKKPTPKQASESGRFSLEGIEKVRPEPQQKVTTNQKQDSQKDSGKPKE